MEEKSELGEVKELLLNLNKRIEILEKEKDQKPSNQQQRYNYSSGFQQRGFGRGNRRGFRGGPVDRGMGLSNYRPTRPTDSLIFQPLCTKCNNKVISTGIAKTSKWLCCGIK